MYIYICIVLPYVACFYRHMCNRRHQSPGKMPHTHFHICIYTYIYVTSYLRIGCCRVIVFCFHMCCVLLQTQVIGATKNAGESRNDIFQSCVTCIVLSCLLRVSVGTCSRRHEKRGKSCADRIPSCDSSVLAYLFRVLTDPCNRRHQKRGRKSR